MSSFDMNIIAVRRNPDRGGKNVSAVYGADRLHYALAQADYTVLAVPITNKTTAMIGEAELAACKPGSCLVNVARGNLIDEGALRRALDSGALAGFASDVWWNYTNSFPATYHFPTPSRTGLHLLDSVVASGDQAGNADDVLERDIEYGSRSLGEFQAGQSPTLRVDLGEGY
jgi:phosphoglycerate dehydrogenase-like enzyme